jgi:hypothetical protein
MSYPLPDKLGPFLELKMVREQDVFAVWVRTKSGWAVTFQKRWPLDDAAKERMAKCLIALAESEFTTEQDVSS